MRNFIQVLINKTETKRTRYAKHLKMQNTSRLSLFNQHHSNNLTRVADFVSQYHALEKSIIILLVGKRKE